MNTLENDLSAEPPAVPRVAEDTLMVLEALLLCAGRKLTVREMQDSFGDTMPATELHALLGELANRWRERGFELAQNGGQWWVRAKPDTRDIIQRAEQRAVRARASKALLETLAVIAYTQPCTKGDVEEKRGMSVTPAVFEHLESRGWIEVIGHRNVPQAPALYATTNRFLDDLGLDTLEDLPSVDASVLTSAATLSDESDFDAYIPYDGPMPLLPGESVAESKTVPDSRPDLEGGLAPPPADAQH